MLPQKRFHKVVLNGNDYKGIEKAADKIRTWGIPVTMGMAYLLSLFFNNQSSENEENEYDEEEEEED